MGRRFSAGDMTGRDSPVSARRRAPGLTPTAIGSSCLVTARKRSTGALTHPNAAGGWERGSLLRHLTAAPVGPRLQIAASG